jgi:hypothetical protein
MNKTFSFAALLVLFLLSISQMSYAQSVTLTPNGAWVPSYTTTARTAITPSDGQLVYDTDTKSFWYGKSTVWTELSSNSTSTLTSNYLPKWNGSSFVNSAMYENNGTFSSGTTNPNGFGSDLAYTHMMLASNTPDSSDFNLVNANNSSNTAWINFAKARGTLTSLQTVNTGDDLGVINFDGHDGTEFTNGAKISTVVDGTVSSSIMPSAIKFTTMNPIGDFDERMRITSSGNVGIGINNPTHKLEVVGDIDSKSAIHGDLTQEIPGTNWDLNNNSAGVTGLGGDASYQAGVYGYIKGTAANTGGVVGVFDLNAWGALAYRDANSDDWGIYSNGSAKVTGTLNTTNFKMTDGKNNGYILQSDADGNGSWVNPISLTITETDPKVGALTANYLPKWNSSTLSDGTIYDNGNVGIGTNNPTNKLDVQNTSGSVKINTQSNTSGANNSIVSPSGQESSTEYRTYSGGSSLGRWSIGKSTAIESGSNAGSNFFVNRLNDAGSYLGQPLAIDRANGTTTIGNDGASTTANTLKINGSLAIKVNRITGNNIATTLDGDDYMLVLASGTSGNSVTLPTASTYTGRTYVIANRSINTVTISAFINSSGASVTTILASETIQVVSDGTEWIKVN